MSWFLAILVVGAIGGVAVVAAGYGASMAEEYDDRPDVRVQADGPLTGADLRGIRFTTALRGYRASEVDSLLARLASELDAGRAGASLEPQNPPPEQAEGELPDWAPPGRRTPSHRSGPAPSPDRE